MVTAESVSVGPPPLLIQALTTNAAFAVSA
jgi:hypothetical protein